MSGNIYRSSARAKLKKGKRMKPPPRHRLLSDRVARRGASAGPIWPLPPRAGDLVKSLQDGCFGIVRSAAASDTPHGRCLVIFLGNGLTVERSADYCEPSRLDKSGAVANFAEILK